MLCYRSLISLLASEDEEVVSIALYDIGEFARFYPNGRKYEPITTSIYVQYHMYRHTYIEKHYPNLDSLLSFHPPA